MISKSFSFMALVVLVVAMLLLTTTTTTMVHADAVDLTDDEFPAFLKKTPYALVMFHSPSCGHCVRFKPDFDKASDELVDNKKVQLAKVDCSASKVICRQYKISGYPDVRFFSPDGKNVEYDEGRSVDAVVNFITTMTSDPITFITTAEEKIKFLNGPTSTKLLLEVPTKTAPGVKSFESAAPELRKIAGACGVFYSSTIKTPKLTFFRKFDEEEVVFKAETIDDKTLTAKALTAFVQEHALPIVGELTPNVYKKYVAKKLPIVWIFIDKDEDSQVAALQDILKPVLSKHKKAVVGGWLDGVKWNGHAKSFGLESSTPGIVIEDKTNGNEDKPKRYVYPKDEITEEDFAAFVEAFVAKKLTPHVKSQPKPEKETVDGLTTLVGTTYHEIVYGKENKDKDIFIAYKKAQCPHCVRLVPAWKELAKEFENDENIIIAEVDGNANQLDDKNVSISGYPTVMLKVAKNNNKFIEYEGDRSVEDLKSFINKNRKSSAKIVASSPRDEI